MVLFKWENKMAKDDYFVIVYKVLTYLYAVLKRKILFNNKEFEQSILKNRIDEDYFICILKMMQDDELIEGLSFLNAWGNEVILINDIDNIRITSKGIEYLSDNSKMNQVKKNLLESADIFASLIKLVFPI